MAPWKEALLVARHGLAIAAFGACLAGAGCSFFKPRADSPMFFVLSAAPPPPGPAGATPRVIGLGPIRLPEYLDRPELVARVAPNQLRIAENERWAEPLRDALVTTLRQDLAAALPGDRVVAHPWDSAEHPDRELAIEVLRFERVSDQAVELEARWQLRDGAGQLRLAKESRIRQATSGADAQAAVAALSQLLSLLSHELILALAAPGG
jgi:uncharacterized protein